MILILNKHDLIKGSQKSLTDCELHDFKVDKKTIMWATAIIYIDNKAFRILKSREVPEKQIADIKLLQEFIDITTQLTMGTSNFVVKTKYK